MCSLQPAGSPIDPCTRKGYLPGRDGHAAGFAVGRASAAAQMNKYGLRHPEAAVSARMVPAPPSTEIREPVSVRWERRYLSFSRARLLSSSAPDRL